MAFYLRKSFRMGPVRLNLSKSGLGVSGGVTGARLGVNSRGRTYVHGGRHGLYYRKHLSGKKVTTRQKEGGGCSRLLLLILMGLAVLFGLTLLFEHPWMLVVAAIAALGYGGHTLRQQHRLTACKRELDEVLVNAETAPDSAEVKRLADACRDAGISLTLRQDIYQAVLDHVLDDQRITDAERDRLVAAREILNLDSAQLRLLHKELFTSAWLEAIEDKRITRAETDWIEQLLDGLDLPREDVCRELEFINELIKAQQLTAPLSMVEPGEGNAHLQANESLYVWQTAQVLTRRGKGDHINWRVHREGNLLLTDKRLLVVGGGTTQLRLDDITEVEIDFDEGLLVLHKRGVGRPTWIRTATPFLLGRKVEILQESP